jgi:hypothetical protein
LRCRRDSQVGWRELDNVPRRESLTGDPHPLNTVEAVATRLTAVRTHRIEHDIACQRAAERVRLDSPAAAAIVEVHTQSVRPRKTHEFEEGRPGDALTAQEANGGPNHLLFDSDGRSHECGRCRTALEPAKELGERSPKALEWWECRKLMAEHRLPVRKKLDGRARQACERWYGHVLEGGLLGKNVQNGRCRGLEIPLPI